VPEADIPRTLVMLALLGDLQGYLNLKYYNE
jgi:hypothetical protein